MDTNLEELCRLKHEGYTYYEDKCWEIGEKCPYDWCPYKCDNTCYGYYIVNNNILELYCSDKTRFIQPKLETIQIKELFKL